MSAPAPSTRRLAIAIGTAATSATVAIGVTAASLLGWFTPATGSSGAGPASEASAPAPVPASSPVILVPVAPMPAPPPAPATVGDVQLAMDDTGRGGTYAHDDVDQERGEHGRDHDDDEGDEGDEGDDDD